MSIGEVLDRLRPEFPEVTISKIRFLEEQGLVDPDRAPSGYRRFSPEHLERLRYVLSVQRDHYLPLRVIREHLEAVDRGEPGVALPGAPAPVNSRPRLASAPEPDEPAATPAGPAGPAEPGRAPTRADLIAAAAGDESLVAALESFGLVEAFSPRSGNGGAEQVYESTALDVTAAAAELAAFGIEPRHLRTFRSAAEREADLLEQVVSPIRQQRSGGSAGRADEAAREIGEVSSRLHTALLRQAIRRNGER